MKHSVEITTPIPSAEVVARRLGLSQERFRVLQDIASGRLSEKRGDTLVRTLRQQYGSSFLKDWRSNARLGTVRKATGKSLIQIVRDHEESSDTQHRSSRSSGKAKKNAQAAS